MIRFAAGFGVELHTWLALGACKPNEPAGDLSIHELFDAVHAVIFTAVGSAIAFLFVDRRRR
jgi:hypothetical protein